MKDLGLQKLEAAYRMLSEVRTVADAKHVADLAATAALWARKSKLGHEAQNKAAVIKLCAERIAGQLLGQLERGKGGAGTHRRNPSADGRVTQYQAALAEAKATRQDASRWQTVAAVPDAAFKAWIAEESRNGEITTCGLVKIARRAQHRQERTARLVEISQGNKTLDGDCGLATVLLSDPPWRYEDASADPTRQIENHYPTMSRDELCALGDKVRGICTPAAVLYLWSPPPLLEDALAVMNAWGFRYRTHGVWDKEKIGCGYYWRQRHELLLFGARGDIPKPEPSTVESSVYCEPRGKHSAKPEHYYEMLERQYPDLPKRELFARSAAREWWLPAWGNQAG